jgi:hypothetical protein
MQERLKTIHEFNRVRNIFLFDELKKILHLFATLKIPVVLLKGAVLAKEVYQDFSVRPLIDLDLLIRPDDRKQAVQNLYSFGYQDFLPERQLGATIDFENEIVLRKPGPAPTHVELHWSLFDAPHYQHHLDLDWFWSTAEQIDFYGVPAQMFGSSAQILHLCSHLVLHHRGDELLWLQDVAELVNQYNNQIDWNEVLEKARAFDLVLPVKQVMDKVVNEWKVPVPEEFLQKLNATAPSQDELRINPTLSGGKRSVGQRFIDDIRSIPGLREQIRFIFSNLFPSPDYMRQRYDIHRSILIPLYYPYRWIVGLKSLL